MTTINCIVLWLLYACIRKWLKWKKVARALSIWISHNTKKEPTLEELRDCVKKHEETERLRDIWHDSLRK